MNDSLAISVSNVSKRYMLYDKPQDRLKQSLFRHFGKKYGHEFWALRNVSFDVHRGETFGIIGRNGSGKSTLLQIIAGTLQATTGQVQVKGQVAALLELGSGFNPEYTGRENIFMNGAIMGIPRGEMEKRLDGIISFADIGEFIDQPVKLYSSGMFVRLAFAVTTGLDADILLIDEALAVGDIFFRQKCYQRLENFRKRGGSILLVSHAIGEVEQFCKRALLLHQGDVVLQGGATEVVKRYYLLKQQEPYGRTDAEEVLRPAEIHPEAEPEATGHDHWPAAESFLPISGIHQVSNGWARCTGVALCDPKGQACSVFQQGETASFFFEFTILRDIEVPTAGVEIVNDKGIIVHGKSTLEYGSRVPNFVARGSCLKFRQDIFLEIAPGEYTFNLGMGSMTQEDYNLRHRFLHEDLDARLIRVCILPSVARFAVIFRKTGDPVPLMHHGVANLPGRCQVQVETGAKGHGGAP